MASSHGLADDASVRASLQARDASAADAGRRSKKSFLRNDSLRESLNQMASAPPPPTGDIIACVPRNHSLWRKRPDLPKGPLCPELAVNTAMSEDHLPFKSNPCALPLDKGSNEYCAHMIDQPTTGMVEDSVAEAAIGVIESDDWSISPITRDTPGVREFSPYADVKRSLGPAAIVAGAATDPCVVVVIDCFIAGFPKDAAAIARKSERRDARKARGGVCSGHGR